MKKYNKEWTKKDVEKHFKKRLIPMALQAAEDTLQGEDNSNRQKTVDSVLDRAGIARKETGSGTNVTFNIPPEYLKDALKGVETILEANNEVGTAVDRKRLGSD